MIDRLNNIISFSCHVKTISLHLKKDEAEKRELTYKVLKHLLSRYFYFAPFNLSNNLRKKFQSTFRITHYWSSFELFLCSLIVEIRQKRDENWEVEIISLDVPKCIYNKNLIQENNEDWKYHNNYSILFQYIDYYNLYNSSLFFINKNLKVFKLELKFDKLDLELNLNSKLEAWFWIFLFYPFRTCRKVFGYLNACNLKINLWDFLIHVVLIIFYVFLKHKVYIYSCGRKSCDKVDSSSANLVEAIWP